MKSENKKIITVSFVLAGVLSGFVLSVLLETFAATFGFVARAMASDVFRHGLPVAVGLGVFLALQLRTKTCVWADEVVSEIRKVVWPSRRDLTAMTVVVCVFVVFSGVMLGFFDFFSGYLVKIVVN